MSNKISLDEIVSIEEIDERATIDIECSGNRLFFANGILTHNSGQNNSDTDLTNTSESFGLPMTVDFFLAAIVTEELQQRGQILFKQLKNRYNDPSYYNKFYVGVDRSRMKLYDLEESAATDGTSSPDRKQHTDIIHDSDDADFSQFKF